MKNFFETILVAFGMFSRVPVPQVEWNEKNRKIGDRKNRWKNGTSR